MKPLETLVAEYLHKAAIEQGTQVRIEYYSGRNMQGKRCLSISGDVMEINTTIVSAIECYINDAKETIIQGTAVANQDVIDEGFEQLDNISNILVPLIHERKQDSLGLDHVVYFPSQEWTNSFDPYMYK